MADGFTGLQGISGDFPVPGPTGGALGAVSAATAPISFVNITRSLFGRPIKQSQIDILHTGKVINELFGRINIQPIKFLGRANIKTRNKVTDIAVKFRTLGLQVTGDDISRISDSVTSAITRSREQATAGFIPDFAKSKTRQQLLIDPSGDITLSNIKLPSNLSGGRAAAQFRSNAINTLNQEKLEFQPGRAGVQQRAGTIKEFGQNAAIDTVFKELENIFNQRRESQPQPPPVSGAGIPGSPDFVGPPEPQPEKPGVGPGTVIKAAGNILRLRIPRLSSRARGRGFFPGGGGGDFTELEKDQNLIIPSGFISKQATTRERAIDPNILEGIR